jgi:CDP-diacylglycerol--glycerol-3-phosphate 3-phosphatidyltransferase
LVAALGAWAAYAGGAWLWVAIAVILLSGLLDNLDGAVAVLSGRTTAWGHVLDSVVDRCCDVLYLVALWAVGAPAAVCVAGGFAMLLAEYVRARASGAGMVEVGVITLFERPTRVLVAAAFLLGAAVFPDSAAGWVAAGSWLWLGLATVALVQVLVAVRRRLP